MVIDIMVPHAVSLGVLGNMQKSRMTRRTRELWGLTAWVGNTTDWMCLHNKQSDLFHDQCNGQDRFSTDSDVVKTEKEGNNSSQNPGRGREVDDDEQQQSAMPVCATPALVLSSS